MSWPACFRANDHVVVVVQVNVVDMQDDKPQHSLQYTYWPAKLSTTVTPPPGICCTRDLLHLKFSNILLSITHYLNHQPSPAMDTERAYTLALADLEAGRFRSIRAAADAYKIDNTNLGRRRRGQRNRVKSHEEQQTLSSLQEQMLVRWILEAEQAGHAFNHAQLKDMASIVNKASGGDGSIGKHWVIRFLQRNPQVHTKKGVSIANQRVHTLYSTNVSAWFSQLSSLLNTKGIYTTNIWNMDETGTALGVCANQTIIGTTATKRSFVSRPEDREWVSVIECISATGGALIPLVIFKGKNVQHQWFIPDKTPKWTYTSSNNAYTSNDIGLQWLQDIFIPQSAKNLASNQYRLLLLDGHRSHTTLDFMWECFTNKIIPYYLIAHASHILQPLDLTIFSSLKRTYRAAIAFYSDLDDSAPVKKQRFLEYYQKARTSALSTKNIESGFTTAGIVPWNPRKVLSSPFIVHRTTDDEIQRPISPPRPIVAPQTLTTPTNRRQLYQAVSQLRATTPLDRDTRVLLSKTSRGFDRVLFKLATTERQLATYKRQVDDQRLKSKKKQPVDPNKVFIDIEDIKASYNRLLQPLTSTTITQTTARAVPPILSPPQATVDPFQRVIEQLQSISRSNS